MNNIYIHSYKDEKIKKIVRKAKNLDRDALGSIALDLFERIKDGVVDLRARKQIKILIFHAPSSSFARLDKKSDHMAKVSCTIKDLAESTMAYNSRIDICLHAFMIEVERLESQHNMNRNDRLKNASKKYQFSFKFHINFINSYDYIYIIDDVITTGITLEVLSRLLENKLEEDEDERKIPVIRTLAYCH